MLLDENLNQRNSAELPLPSTKNYPAWVHELIAHEVDVAIERYRRRVEPPTVKEQEMVEKRPY